jgi:DNA repair protein RadC
MKIFESKISYNLLQDGPSESLDSPEKVVDYMCGAFEQFPTQESFQVLLLNRKNVSVY